MVAIKNTNKSIKSLKKGKHFKKQRKRKQKANVNKETIEKSVEGFTIIGDVNADLGSKAKRILPEWLANPTVVNVELTNAKSIEALDSVCKNLKPLLVNKLKECSIVNFFPVQRQVIPWLLHPSNNGAYYRPRDVCVSAPTGSGKTLTYVLPLINKLLFKNVTCIRALVVLPVRELAIQVYKVFQNYASGTNLKVALLIGQKSFSTEQSQLVKDTLRGYVSQVDIIVATPGKLVDHVELTKGFCLHRLKYLVIDEADRMMEEVNQDWLNAVERKVQSEDTSDCYLCCDDNGPRNSSGPLNVESLRCRDRYVQKLLFSATLSQNPEKLQKLRLHQPKLFTSVSSSTKMPENGDEGEFIGKFTTPVELKEYFVSCDISLKPLIVYHLLNDLNLKKVLCFTKSVDSTSRLSVLMSSMGVKVAEISSNLRVERRERIIKSFISGQVNLLVCSDVMARGMDFDYVDHIVSYDLPPYLKTYIHRVGRTARAGRKGTSYVLLEKKEVPTFQKMLSGAGKNAVDEWTVQVEDIKKHEQLYKEALSKSATLIKHPKK